MRSVHMLIGVLLVAEQARRHTSTLADRDKQLRAGIADPSLNPRECYPKTSQQIQETVSR